MDNLETVLRRAQGLTDDQRADLWDIYTQAKDRNELAARLQTYPGVPDDLKADLWDLKPAPELAPKAAQRQPEGIKEQTVEYAKGIGKEALRHTLNLGGIVRDTPVIGSAVNAVSPDPLESVSRAVGMDRPVMARNPSTGEELPTTFRDAQKLEEMGYQVYDMGQTGTNPKPLSMFSAEGQDQIGLDLSNKAQRFGAGTLDMAEYIAPGGMVTKGAKALAALKPVVKMGQYGKFAAQAAPEVASAVSVSKIQDRENPAMFAGMLAAVSPVYGRALNWGGKKLPPAIASKIPEVSLSPRQMLTKAIKPYVRNLEFADALNRAVPEIYEAGRRMGVNWAKLEREQIWDQLAKAVKMAKEDIIAPYRDLLSKSHNTVSGDLIADKAASAITKQMKDDSPSAIQGIIDRLERTYRGRTITLSEAEDALHFANAKTKSHFALYPRGRYEQTISNPDIAARMAEANALRDQIYSKLDELSDAVRSFNGKGLERKAREIKKTYGALLNFEGELQRRANVAMRQQPESLMQQIMGAETAADMASSLVSGGPKMAVLQGAARSIARRKAASMIRERNSSEYLIKKAFTTYGAEVERWRKGQRFFIGVPTVMNTVSGNP